jgi:PAS domain S-box-containing protein
MPHPDLAPLAQRMDARFDELVERLTEQLPNASSFYATLPAEARRAAAVNLYNILRDSVEEGGITRFGQAITQIAQTRAAQGGTPDDLRAATDMIRQINLSLVTDLTRIQPTAAGPAYAWLDRLAAISLDIFGNLAREALARQAAELTILMELSERAEHAEAIADIVGALSEQLPSLGVDRAIVSLRIDAGPEIHEIIGMCDIDKRTPELAVGTRFAPEPLLRADTPDATCLPLNVADLDPAQREQLALADIATVAVLPLRGQRGIYGLLLLGYRQARQFAPGEQRFLASLARLLRNRISNLRLIERLREQIERATIFQTLIEQASDMITMSDPAGTISYANAAAAGLLGVERPADLLGKPFTQFFHAADLPKSHGGMSALLADGQAGRGEYTLVTAAGELIPVAFSSIPLMSVDGRSLGMGGITRDERERLALIESLRQSNEEQQRTLDLLRRLSTPLVPVIEGILVMPIVGDLDSRRADQILETLLEGVMRASADIVILDITGVPLVDTGVANALIQAARAVRLLGAQALLVGITPEVAQTLVGLGIDLGELATRSNLQSGIAYALRRRGYRIVAAGELQPA